MYPTIEQSLFRRFLLVFVLIILGSSLSSAEDLKLIREKSFSAKDWDNVYVNASGADVNIESWNKQETYVKVFGNRRAEEKLNISIEQESGTVRVIAKKRGSFFNWFGNNISVRIEIRVPKNQNTHIETSGGDINIANINGVFKLDTSGGDITLDNTNGKLKAETSGGDINLSVHKGEMNLSTSGGDIICNGTNGDLRAETSGGDIKISSADGKIYTDTSGGDITIDYTGINKGVEAETSGGSIHVKLPSNFKAKVHLETTGGDISNNFNNARTMHVSRGEVDAEFNGGGEILRLETTGGDVTVDQK
jgi:DUF4097 and DUF4098 domain-containing protein YvlB